MPFPLIHNDIWGPSTVHNIYGACWFVSSMDDCTQSVLGFSLKTKTRSPFHLSKKFSSW